MRGAVVLLSGGIDSAVTLAWTISQGYRAHTLTIDYGQVHNQEIEAAKRVATAWKVESHYVLSLKDLPQLFHSALTGKGTIPKGRWNPTLAEIPPTYVPARNLLFLSLAAGWGESLEAEAIAIGVNAVDFAGYPDCRPAFLEAFQKVLEVGTKQGVLGRPIKILAPLISLTKAEIITLGTQLGVDFSLTLSCYDPDLAGVSCGECDSCLIRKKGFREAGIPDPTHYLR